MIADLLSAIASRKIPYPDIDPVFLRIGPLQFRWYGLMYLLGLGAAYFVIKTRAAARNIALAKEQIYDIIVFAAVGVFAGGRLGYCLFYNFSYYLEHPLKIFAVWEGGMSFHGGLLGVVVALWLYSRRSGVPAYTIADLAATSAPIGLGLGRLGNFINGELYGRPTDVPWCMVFPGGGFALYWSSRGQLPIEPAVPFGSWSGQSLPDPLGDGLGLVLWPAWLRSRVETLRLRDPRMQCNNII